MMCWVDGVCHPHPSPLPEGEGRMQTALWKMAQGGADETFN